MITTIQSKLSFDATKNNQIIYNFLYSKDNSYLERWSGRTDIYAEYGNSYHGLVWKSVLTPRIFSEFIASHGVNFWDNRANKTEEEKLNLAENSLSWNGVVSPHHNHEIGCGISYKHIAYSYDIQTAEISQDQRALEDLVQSYFGTMTISPRTYKLAGYLQDKFRICRQLYINAGLRYDFFDYNEDQQLSPRLGIAWHVAPRTILRAAWGYYYQAPIYAELTNQTGADYNPGFQKSIHYVAGIEKTFTEHFSIRVESYYKSLDQMIGHYFEFKDNSDLPDLKYGNPNTGSCYGIEFFVNGAVPNGLSVWLAYAYSRSTIDAYYINWEKLQLEKQSIPRFTDQPHNLSLFINYKLPKSWNLNLKWRYLSGIPYTPRYPVFYNGEPQWEYGENYADRYPAYHRLDVRMGKTFTFNRYKITAFLEVKNLFDHKNVLLYDFRIENGQHVRKAFYTLPFLPTIEFKMSF